MDGMMCRKERARHGHIGRRGRRNRGQGTREGEGARLETVFVGLVQGDGNTTTEKQLSSRPTRLTRPRDKAQRNNSKSMQHWRRRERISSLAFSHRSRAVMLSISISISTV